MKAIKQNHETILLNIEFQNLGLLLTVVVLVSIYFFCFGDNPDLYSYVFANSKGFFNSLLASEKHNCGSGLVCW